VTPRVWWAFEGGICAWGAADGKTVTHHYRVWGCFEHALDWAESYRCLWPGELIVIRDPHGTVLYTRRGVA